MKMHKAIVDSSALLSLNFSSDSNNKKALEISALIEKENKELLIPEDIFSETMNVIGKKSTHEKAARIGKLLVTDKRFQLVSTTLPIRANAIGRFERQPQSVSFTDCLVMAFADDFETREIFGFDQAFVKNGYIRIGIDRKK